MSDCARAVATRLPDASRRSRRGTPSLRVRAGDHRSSSTSLCVLSSTLSRAGARATRFREDSKLKCRRRARCSSDRSRRRPRARPPLSIWIAGSSADQPPDRSRSQIRPDPTGQREGAGSAHPAAYRNAEHFIAPSMSVDIRDGRLIRNRRPMCDRHEKSCNNPDAPAAI